MNIIKKHLHRHFGGHRGRTDGVVLHSTGSAKATSQYGWFNNPVSKASSNVHIADDGTIEEYVPDERASWANGEGNWRLLAIETQGDGTTRWTDAQLESIAELIASWHKKYGFPIRLMSSSKRTEKGIGYHRLGVPRSKWGQGVWLVAGGEKWSKAIGKVCPGDKRIAQMPELVERVNALLGAPSKAVVVPKAIAKPKQVKVPSVTVYAHGSKGAKVKSLQKQLNASFPSYSKLKVDGVFGVATEAVVKKFQKRAGLVADGVVGALTQNALKKYGVKL